MRISLVVPTINRQFGLRRLLTSIATSGRKPEEVIIVEQGDESLTRSLVREFPALSITVLPLATRSASIARNVGIRASSGDIIAFLDDDIEVSPEHFAHMEEYFESHPGVLGVTGGSSSFDMPAHSFTAFVKVVFWIYSLQCRNIVLLSGANDHTRGQNLMKEHEVEWFPGHNMALRRSVFEEFLFHEQLLRWSFGEDVWLCYRVHKRYPRSLRFVPSLHVMHYEEGGSGRHVSTENLRMKIVYRYLFWREEVFRGPVSIMAYVWSQIGTLIFVPLKNPSIFPRLIREYLASYWFILKHRRASVDVYNNFIFGKYE